MHRVEERVQIPFVAASSLAHLGERTILIAVPLDTRLNDMEE